MYFIPCISYNLINKFCSCLFIFVYFGFCRRRRRWFGVALRSTARKQQKDTDAQNAKLTIRGTASNGRTVTVRYLSL